MKVIHIYGDDYSAVSFEQSGMKPKEVYDLVILNDGHYVHDDGDNYFEAKSYEFEEVDTKFILFIKNTIMDCDDSKHNNFYIVKEK